MLNCVQDAERCNQDASPLPLGGVPILQDRIWSGEGGSVTAHQHRPISQTPVDNLVEIIKGDAGLEAQAQAQARGRRDAKREKTFALPGNVEDRLFGRHESINEGSFSRRAVRVLDCWSGTRKMVVVAAEKASMDDGFFFLSLVGSGRRGWPTSCK